MESAIQDEGLADMQAPARVEILPRPEPPNLAGVRGTTLSARAALQILASAVLAIYPWLVAWNLAGAQWRAWLVAVGLDALWLALQPARTKVAQLAIAALSLAAAAGLAFNELLMVYIRVVNDMLGRDYHIAASLLRAASVTPGAPPQNLRGFIPGAPTYLQGYFDPITPLINRLFDLTHDPFRLLAFHSAMVLTAPFIAWWIASRRPPLAAFQLALPVALLVHPSMLTQMLSDYHTSEIGAGLLLLGTYWFFLDRGKRARAFGPLLLGTVTKIVYWPSWIMFGVISAFRRQWRWTAAYGLAGSAALAVHQLMVRGQPTPGISTFFGAFGSTPLEMVTNLVLHPERWLPLVVQPDRWLFFWALLLPFGFCIVAYPLGLIPVLPLVAFTLLDSSAQGFRYSIASEYGTEFLGFIVGASLVGLAVAPRWLRVGVLVALTIGMPVSVVIRPGLYWTNINTTTAKLVGQSYARESGFAACAVSDEPALVTNYNWVTYERETPDRVWVDNNERGMTASDAPWDSFRTLVYPADARVRGSLTDYPALQPGYDVQQYGALLDRMPVRLVTPKGWTYQGGQRLAGCAARFGYQVSAS